MLGRDVREKVKKTFNIIVNKTVNEIIIVILKIRHNYSKFLMCVSGMSVCRMHAVPTDARRGSE